MEKRGKHFVPIFPGRRTPKAGLKIFLFFLGKEKHLKQGAKRIFCHFGYIFDFRLHLGRGIFVGKRGKYGCQRRILRGGREGLNLDAIGHAPMPQWFGEEKNRFSFFWGREKRRGNDIF